MIKWAKNLGIEITTIFKFLLLQFFHSQKLICQME